MALPARKQLKYWGLAAVIFAVIMWALGNVLMPFILGGAIAYIIDPLADRLERAGLSREGATAVITVGAVLIFLIIMALSTAPMVRSDVDGWAEITGPEARYAQAEGFEDVTDIVLGRCSMCHTAEPGWEGLHWAPKGVLLETQADVARHAHEIYMQAGRTHAMPPPNAIQMDPDARQQILAWYRGATD